MKDDRLLLEYPAREAWSEYIRRFIKFRDQVLRSALWCTAACLLIPFKWLVVSVGPLWFWIVLEKALP